jgi:hypothetical protein
MSFMEKKSEIREAGLLVGRPSIGAKPVPSEQLSIRVTALTAKNLKTEAVKRHLPMSEFLRRILEKHLGERKNV